MARARPSLLAPAALLSLLLPLLRTRPAAAQVRGPAANSGNTACTSWVELDGHNSFSAMMASGCGCSVKTDDERRRPRKAPGQAHNLTGWQLQTCLRSPRAVNALKTYTDRNFFLGEDGTIVMLTPDNASVVTAHSSHPRTEFRETGVADWALDSGEHVLNLRTAVLHVSDTTGETIIAQIHGSVDEEIAKVIKLRWTRGR
jgi:hypothetical protein